MTNERGDLLRGTLEMLILRTLTQGPLHGYGITERIQECSDDILRVEEGSLYPALYRMQRRGWLEVRQGRSENNRRAKFYSLTPLGRQQMRAALERWNRFSQGVEGVLQRA